MTLMGFMVLTTLALAANIGLFLWTWNGFNAFVAGMLASILYDQIRSYMRHGNY